MRALLACAALLLAGCLSSPAPGPAPAPVQPTHPAELGGIQSQAPAVAAVATQDFEVKAPAGGATSVHWSLTMPGSAVFGSVEGPGCAAPAGNVVAQVGLQATIGGACDDLKEGSYTFHVRFSGPATGYSAAVGGLVAGTA
jgi:hypothetical protein